MPESPEIIAHADRLEAEFGGATLSGFRAISFTALKTFSPTPDDAFGTSLTSVTARGKHLVLHFDDIKFVIHLMQGGRLKPDEKQSPKPRGGLARLLFEDGRALLLTEAGKEHRAGIWVVAGDIEASTAIDGLGPDALSLTPAALGELFASENKRIHGFLRMQRKLAGIGRRLANEICHRARVSPFAMTQKLSTEEIVRIHAALHECIEESLAYERSRNDMSSSKERPGSVHHRAGDPCPVCADDIRAVEYNRYTVNYCATCQTGGKVLADNTTSKFLK